MLIMEQLEAYRYTCGHMIKNHDVIRKTETINGIQKIKCEYCICDRIEL